VISLLLVRALLPGGAAPTDAAAAGVFLYSILSSLGWLLVAAALTWQTAHAVTGGDVTLARAYREALGRTLPLAVSAVLVGLVGAAMFVGLSLLGGMIAVAAVVGAALGSGGFGAAGAPGAAPPPALIIAIAGMIGLVFVAIVLFVMTSFFAIAPAVVVERAGPVAALGRSWRLSRGARLRIAGVLIVSWLIVTLPVVGVLLIAGFGPAMVDAQAAATLSLGRLFLQQALGLASNVLTVPFFVACLTLLYFDRRVRLEAYDLEVAVDALPSQSA
jgi:hypothetical protein